jgi:hypothetical protein
MTSRGIFTLDAMSWPEASEKFCQRRLLEAAV